MAYVELVLVAIIILMLIIRMIIIEISINIESLKEGNQIPYSINPLPPSSRTYNNCEKKLNTTAMNYLETKDRIEAIRTLITCQVLLSQIEDRGDNFKITDQIIKAELELIKKNQELDATQ